MKQNKHLFSWFPAGQFICGNKKCRESDGLRSWEVNFAYMEDGSKKNALVKLRKKLVFYQTSVDV